MGSPLTQIEYARIIDAEFRQLRESRDQLVTACRSAMELSDLAFSVAVASEAGDEERELVLASRITKIQTAISAALESAKGDT